MVKFIDDFLNGHTQYRLMFYFLILLVVVAVILSFFGALPFHPVNIIFSTIFLITVCWVANTLFAKLFKAFTNLESVYITALILTLIITPIRTSGDLLFLSGAAVLAMASKYIIVINRKHLFNPAAFAVALTALTLNYSASWWVGTSWMVPFMLIGVLIVKKMQRFNLAFSFLTTFLVVILGISVLKGNDLFSGVQKLILDSPIFFFMFVMLIEPLTTPPGKKRQMLYGGLVGLLFVYIPPEVALLIGNSVSYIISPKEKLLLKLKEKKQTAPDIYDFIFERSEKRTSFIFNLDGKFNFLPGQYIEWTLSHPNPDSRGVRRYFTIAASPTEKNLRIGVKFFPNGSSYKKALLAMETGDRIFASQLAGEFTLPEDPGKKLCFMAGGIGITPYRSITKYLLDIRQERDIVLLYSNKLAEDIVYKDIFDNYQKLGMKTVYVLTDIVSAPKGWTSKVGYIDEKIIREEVPDYKDRIFYISGPHSMVDTFEKVLKGIGIPGNQIKVDFFPGYA